MSIRYDFRKTGMFPVITCDVCKDIIQDARKAVVVWNENGGIAFGHKGECSHALDWRTGFPYWDDLPIFLMNLSANTGCGLKELRAAEKRHAYLYSIGLAAADSKSNAKAMQVQEKPDATT